MSVEPRSLGRGSSASHGLASDAPKAFRRSRGRRIGPSDQVATIKSLHRAWERAEVRYRELAPGSPEAAESLEGVNQLWAAYEEALGKAIGRGALSPPDDKPPA
jgi:hypothetical protein